MRPICLTCSAEMNCTKNGVLVKVNSNHYYSADQFTCPSCNRSMITGFGESMYFQDEKGIAPIVDLTEVQLPLIKT